MNKKILTLSVLAAVVLGAACALLWRQLQSLKAREQAAEQAARVEAETRTLHEERLRDAERERARVSKQNEELAQLAGTLRAAEARQASNLTALTRQVKANAPGANADASNAGTGLDFGKMMKDPAMKEMIRTTQKSMMKTMYGPLFKDLNLPADQQKQLTDLILDAQLGGMETAGELFGSDGEARTNAIQVVSEKQKKLTEDIKSMLGPDKYAQYEDYQKSMADRIVLNQFQQQAAGTDTALQDEQLKQLIQVMKEERARVPAVISEDPSRYAETLAKVLDAAAIEQQMQWQEDFSRRVKDRASKLLSPDQFKEFIDFQEQQNNMQRLGLKMAREMFGGDKAPAGAVPVPEK